MIRILTPGDSPNTVPLQCRSFLAKWPGQYIAVCSLMCHAAPATYASDALALWLDLELKCISTPYPPKSPS